MKIDAGKSTSFTLSVLAADQYFSQLGIKAGQEALLYWTVKETGNTTAAASDVAYDSCETYVYQVVTT